MSSATESLYRVERFPLVPRLLTVRRTRRLSPRMIRLTLGGDALAGFQSPSPEDHVKLVVPVNGTRPTMPVAGPDGLAFPDGRPHMRDYTPRRFDADAGELDIDVVLHGAGLVSTWAIGARPGDEAGVLGPRGSHILNRAFDWYLLIGDETALPTIARWLETLPPGARGLAIVEVEDAAEEQEIASASDARIVWVHRNGAPPGTADLLLGALRDLALPTGEGLAWIGGEATSIRPLRRHLIDERGVSKSAVRFSGHWKRGVADWDHHEEIEV